MYSCGVLIGGNGHDDEVGSAYPPGETLIWTTPWMSFFPSFPSHHPACVVAATCARVCQPCSHPDDPGRRGRHQRHGRGGRRTSHVACLCVFESALFLILRQSGPWLPSDRPRPGPVHGWWSWPGPPPPVVCVVVVGGVDVVPLVVSAKTATASARHRHRHRLPSITKGAGTIQHTHTTPHASPPPARPDTRITLCTLSLMETPR